MAKTTRKHRPARKADVTTMAGAHASHAADRAAGETVGPLTPAAEAVALTASKPPTKVQLIAELLRRPQGARVEDLTKATGWQAHSVRGAIAGALKKQQKLAVLSEKTATGRVYRITDTAGAEAQP